LMIHTMYITVKWLILLGHHLYFTVKWLILLGHTLYITMEADIVKSYLYNIVILLFYDAVIKMSM